LDGLLIFSPLNHLTENGQIGGRNVQEVTVYKTISLVCILLVLPLCYIYSINAQIVDRVKSNEGISIAKLYCWFATHHTQMMREHFP